MKLIKNKDGIILKYKNKKILEHSKKNPCIMVGFGKGYYKMKRGNVNVQEKHVKLFPLKEVKVINNNSKYTLKFFDKHNHVLTINIIEEKERLIFKFHANVFYNRFKIKLASTEKEHIYGCGEQFTKFDLKGEKVNIWISEPLRIDENKKKKYLNSNNKKNNFLSYIQKRINKVNKIENAGSYFAQPTFISSQKYYCHVKDEHYMSFDFQSTINELMVWGVPSSIIIGVFDKFDNLMINLTDLLGRQPMFPDWIYNGVILEMQNGIETIKEKIKKTKEKGISISAVLCKDWTGEQITTFGKEINWNWEVDSTLYPNLLEEIKNLNNDGIHFLGYINPFLMKNSKMFREAMQKGFLIKDKYGDVYIIKDKTYYSGIVDLSNPRAYKWFKEIIKKNIIELGFSGWIADFGDYLPSDAVLYRNRSAEYLHNLWSVLFAKLNREAIEESGKKEKVFFITRSGFSGVQKYATHVWTGKQCADFSKDYGLASIIPAMLSLSMSGFGLSHSEIGGDLIYQKKLRSKQLLLRWIEMSAFTPLMIINEANIASRHCDDEIILHLSKFGEVYKKLSPYIKKLVQENEEKGIPVIRPLFFHYHKEEKTYNCLYEYLLGRELLIAPVIEENEKVRKVYLPKDQWIHLFTKKVYRGGREITIEVPIGMPAVFYRKRARDRSLFESITNNIK